MKDAGEHVMLWEAFSEKDVCPLVEICKKVNDEMYKGIL